MKSRQRGFTLIELIVVIVILGILAATALPKFVDLGGDARKAAMKGVEGSMRAANGMIYAKAAAASKLGSGTNAISYGSSSLNVTYGYATTLNDLKLAMDLSADFVNNAGNTQLQHSSATTPANCRVSYTQATATDPPQYGFLDTGC